MNLLELTDEKIEDLQKKYCGGAAQGEKSKRTPLLSYVLEYDENGKAIKKDRGLETIRKDIFSRFDDWPRVLAGVPFVCEGETILTFEGKKDIDQFFSWLKEKNGADVDFPNGSSLAKRGEVFANICQFGKQYSTAYAAPFWPERKDAFCYAPTLPAPSPNCEVFEGFIDFFNPATPADRTLIKALVLGAYYYEPGEERPSYLITTADAQGSGKSKLFEKIARLFREIALKFKMKVLKEKPEQLTRQILDSIGRRTRFALFDNEDKTLDDATVAEAITAEFFKGLRPFGTVTETRANDITFAFTMNGASASADISSRSWPIKIREPREDEVFRVTPDGRELTWNKAIDEYEDRFRWQIFADMRFSLENAPLRKRQGKDRFAGYTGRVLSAASRNDDEFFAAIAAIEEAATHMNADRETAEALLACFEEFLASCPGYMPLIPVVIPAEDLERIAAAAGGPLQYRRASYFQLLINSGLLAGFSKKFSNLPDREDFRGFRKRSFFYGTNLIPDGQSETYFQLLALRNDAPCILLENKQIKTSMVK